MIVFEELTFYDGNAVSSLTFSRSMTHALLFNHSIALARGWPRDPRAFQRGSDAMQEWLDLLNTHSLKEILELMVDQGDSSAD